MSSAPARRSTRRAVRQRVAEARERQRARLAGTPARCNGEMDGRAGPRHVRLDAARRTRRWPAPTTAASLSARGRHRVLRVARTIADLEQTERVTLDHVLTALALRQRDGLGGAGGMSAPRACDRCLARPWLLERLRGHLDRVRGRIAATLELPDADLVAAVAGADRDRVTRELDGFDAASARLRCAARRGGADLSLRPGLPAAAGRAPGATGRAPHRREPRALPAGGRR